MFTVFCLVVLVAFMGVVLADSASAAKLVGNLDADGDDHVFIGDVIVNGVTRQQVGAQGFTTGSNANGYLITGVDIPVRNSSTSRTASVSIHRSTSSGNRPVNEKLYDLAGSVASAGVQRFTAPPGAVLNGSTTYFLNVFGGSGTGYFSVNLTESDDEDSVFGWSVQDDSLFSYLGLWNNRGGESMQFAVHGSPLSGPPEPQVTGSFVLGTGSGSEIKGLWGDGDTLWTLNEGVVGKVSAYELVGGSLVRNSGKDFSVLDDEGAGVDAANELVYVTDIFVGDDDDTFARAYTLSGARRSGDDINISDHPAASGSSGFWSNGTILLVSNSVIKNVSVYLNGVYDSSKNFKPSNACAVSHGVWSDGETLWVVASNCGTPVEGSFLGTGVELQAYRLSDFSRDSVRDIPLGANDDPRGLWGDGSTLWVGRDRTGSNDEVFFYKYRDNAYGLKLEGRAFVGETLVADTSGVEDFNGMPDSPVFSYQWQYGDGSDIPGATGSAYNVTSDDLGKNVRVKVTFTDKARYEEQVFSGFTSEVGVRMSEVSPDAFTGSFVLGTGSGSEIKGLWGDGDTLWTLNEGVVGKVSAYELVGGSLVRNSGKDFSVLDDEGAGVDAANELVYVTDIFVGDDDDTFARAYTLSGARRSGDDINISDHPAASGSSGFWSNGTILLVSNSVIKNVSVYLNGVYDSSKNFKPSNACAVSHGVWSDGETLWVVASNCGTPVEGSFLGTGVELQAYRLSDFSRDSVRDIPLGANDDPRGLWGDGSTLWVGRDRTGSNDEVFFYKYRDNAYGLKLEGRAFVGETLVADTSGVEDFNGMPDSPVFSYQWQYGDGSDIPGATGSAYNVTSDDLGKNVRVKVTFTDKARYEEQVFSGFTSEVGVRMSEVSPDAFTGSFVLGTGSGSEIKGLWGDGDTLWTLNEGVVGKVSAYELVGGSLVRNSGKDFSVLDDEGAGVDAANELVYVTDIFVGDDDDTFARAYTLSGARRSGDDINISDHPAASGSSGFWSNGTILLVSNSVIKNVSVYLNGVYDSSKNFKPSNACAVSHGVWSDGETLWVVASNCGTPVEGSFLGTGVELQAYRLSDFSRDSVRDIPLGANDDPRGLWGDGSTLWVGRDRTGSNDEVFFYKYRDNAYGLKLEGRAFVGETLVADTSGVEDFNGMPDSPVFSYQWQYGDGSDIPGATGSAYNVTSDDLGKGIRVKVTFTDKARYEEELVSVAVGEAYSSLNSDNDGPWGVWSDGQVMWVVDDVDDKVYAYDAYPNVLNSGQTFDLASVNDDPRGVWSDGVTMWVAEGGSGTTDYVYAYKMSNKNRDLSKDFRMSDSQDDFSPVGLWSDGEVMWVVKEHSSHAFAYVHAYNLSGTSSDVTKRIDDNFEQNFHLEFGHDEVGGVWSDGVTVWVVDRGSNDSVVAYNFSGGRVSGKDVVLSSENNASRGIWSDGSTLWVVDADVNRFFLYTIDAVGRSDDFDKLDLAGNGRPWGVWGDRSGRTMYVLDSSDDRVYAYDFFTKVPLLYKSFYFDQTITSPRGLWSDGETLWILDAGSDTAFAHSLSDKSRDSSKDVNLSPSNTVSDPLDLWSDGETMWAVFRSRESGTPAYVRAYNLSDGGVDESKSFVLPSGHDYPVGVWSDGVTLWVVERFDNKGVVVAYDLLSGGFERVGGLNLYSENSFPSGIWSDGVIFWVAEDLLDEDEGLYAYSVDDFTSVFVPLAPYAPTFGFAQNDSLYVLWSEPSGYGVEVDDYDVQYREDGNGTFTNWSHSGSGTSATITGLKNSTKYHVRVRAGNVNGYGGWSDVSSRNTTANVVVNNPPVFGNVIYVVNETVLSVGTVVAEDADVDDSVFNYSIVSGEDGALFSITSGGVLSFKVAPDFERPGAGAEFNRLGYPYYEVIVKAFSGVGVRETFAEAVITVYVFDVNESPSAPDAPVLSSPLSTSLLVTWSAPGNMGSAINDYDIQYRQGSSGSFSNWSYSGNSTSATITGLTVSTLYEVRVRASSDEGTSNWSQVSSFTTGSVATNNAPVFTSSSSFSVNENVGNVGTVVASDVDGQDSVTGYSISGGDDRSRFSITSGGVLTFDSAPNSESPVDVGGDNVYNLVVTAASGTGSRVRTATQSITVRVDDVAEAPSRPGAPTLSSPSTTSLSVAWSAPSNTGPPVNDYDVQYRQGTTGSFSNRSHSGTSRSTTITGLTASTLYEVRVRAGNAEGTGNWSQVSSFTTRSVATNNNPVFTSSSSFSVNENVLSVGTVVASDSDSQDSITGYGIWGGVDQSLFSITNAGVLTFDSAPDFESPSDYGGNNEYNLVVRATSGTGDRRKFAYQSITVSVGNVTAPSAPSAPVLSSSTSTSLSVVWSAPSNTGPVITGYDVQYRQGTTGSFSNQSHTGTSRSTTITGLTASTQYQVRVRASNAEGTSGWSQTVSFSTGSSSPNQVTNNAPVFTSISSFSVNENSRSVGTVVASDSDSQDSVTGYSVSGGVDRVRFSITGGGVLTFDSAPNYESPADVGGNNEYNLVVRATSGTGSRVRSAAQSIVVSVDDVAEAPSRPDAPTLSSPSSTSLSVAWSAPSNTGPAINDYDVQYRQGTTGSFSNLSYSGTSRTATIIGLTASTSYQVRVRASNAEGTGSWSQTSSFTTGSSTPPPGTNANPVFTSSSSFSVNENSRSVGTVVAFDGDGQDSVTGYSVSGGVDSSRFSITNAGVLTFDSVPNYESPADVGGNNEYNLVVRVTSGSGTRVRSATQVITVMVRDVAEGVAVVPSGDVVLVYSCG